MKSKSIKITFINNLFLIILIYIPANSYAEAPIANFDKYILTENGSISVDEANGLLANDSDLEGDELTVNSILNGPEHGSLVWSADGSLSYSPDTGFFGTDNFRYIISDGTKLSESGLVIFSVQPSGIMKVPGDWTTFGNNPSHTGFQAGFVGNDTASHLWSKTIQGVNTTTNQVVVAESQVYVTAGGDFIGSYIVALSTRTGEVAWSREFDSAFSTNPPTFADGNVYFQRGNHSGDTQLWSLDGASGSVNWKAPFAAQWEYYYAPTVADGKVWINGGSYGGLYGFKQHSEYAHGEQLFFENSLEQFSGWTPSYSNGKLYTLVGKGFREHDPLTGAVKQEVKVSSSFFGLGENTIIAIENSIGYFLNGTHLTALDLTDFSVIWQVESNQRNTPAVSNNIVYLILGSEIKAYDAITGQFISSYQTDEPILSFTQPIITDDSVIVSTSSKIFIFDRFSNALKQTIDQGGLISLSDGALYIADSNKVSAWKIGFRSRERAVDQRPFVKEPIENITISQGTTNVSFDLLDVFSDPDDEDSLLNFGVETTDEYGLVEASINGNELQLSLADFEGEVIVTVTANSFGQVTKSSFIVKIVNTDLLIELFDVDGNSIAPGQTVSGALTGKITINNKMGEHAQFYQNFRTLPINGTTHIHSNHWERTFNLDTSSFYDGENLISMHVHPVNIEGESYITKFNVGQFKIVTSNNNPSPNGDTQLPVLSIDRSKILVSRSELIPGHVIDAKRDAFDVQDDFGLIQIDQRRDNSNKAQVIPHLGASVLGRFRWTGNSPPWGEDFDSDIFGDVHLINFQKETKYKATIVFFLNDDSGRASYGFYAFDMPALAEEERGKYTLPTLDSNFLNVSQGQEIIIQEDEDFSIKVDVNVTAPMLEKFPIMTTWIGNRAVAETRLADHAGNIGANGKNIEVDVKVPIDEIRKLQNSRQGGNDSVAFAIWNDFSGFNNGFRSESLPSSEHVHVSMIRTADIDANFQDNDNDNIIDSEDNCPNHYNPTQLDTDGNGLGDACYGEPLKLNQHLSLGEYFAGGSTSIKNGYSLYVFDNDLGSENSVCYDTCAEHWPPLLVSNPEELDAITGISNLGTIIRNDGSVQVTHYGKPLYFYASDLGIGDSSGHGVNGVWWLAIANPLGDFEWSEDTIEVTENSGSVDIILNRINGVSGEISVQLKTVAGTASSNLDFTEMEQSIVFSEGELSKTISISIIDDATEEDNESLRLELSNPTSGSSILRATMSITITDNDEPQTNIGGTSTTKPTSSGGGGSLNIMMLFMLVIVVGLKALPLSNNSKLFRCNKR